MPKDDVFYAAMLARDARFDGKFFVGVKTTGIYCRPICPARPKRENVEFYSSAAAAEKAGYRPCLRCRPESAPASPAWIGKSAVVRRAVKALDSQEALAFDENQFAEKFGVTARHLRRLFVEELGKTPKQLSFESRLNTSRKLIAETTLPISAVAFAAGFRSVRRFNDAFRDRFQRTPSAIRRSPIAEEGITVSLAYRPPFDFAGLLDFYRTHPVGNLEWVEPGRMGRVVSFGGKVGEVILSDDPARNRLLVRVDFPASAYLHTILGRVRTMFDLGADPVVVANALEADPSMKKIALRHAGIRLPSGWDPFELAIATILGQLVSVERGRALLADLIAALGEPTKLVRNGKPVHLFPTPAAIAESNLKFLKSTGARKETLRAFAAAVASGKISLEPTQDVAEFEANVRAIKGIGPWSASYMALKVLRHTDAFPETDLILARALEIHPPAALEKVRPWRGYAAALFWREYSQILQKRKK